MLYTPLLPEAASGTIEPRHVVVPLRQMCPHAELVLGHITRHDRERRTVVVESLAGELEIGYERLVVALGAITRTLPVPGLAEHASDSRISPTRSRCAIACSSSSSARPSIPHDASELGFVFVGAGYAGVEALAELHDMVQAALRYYPELRGRPAALGTRRRSAEDPSGDPAPPRRVRRPPPREAWHRDPCRDDARVVRRHGGRALGRDARARANARLDGRRPRQPAARRARATARRARPRRRRRHASRRGDRRRLGARRLRRHPQHEDARASSTRRRASTRFARRGDSRRTSPATREPYGYRMLGQVATLGRFKGSRRSPACTSGASPGWFVDADVPPVPAAAPDPKAAGRRRLDGCAVLPPRHRRAVDARPSAAARRLGSAGGGDVRPDPRRRRERMGLAPRRSGAARARPRPRRRRSASARTSRPAGESTSTSSSTRWASARTSSWSATRSAGSRRRSVCARIAADRLVLVAGMIPAPGELFEDWWSEHRLRGRADTATSSTTTSAPTLAEEAQAARA